MRPDLESALRLAASLPLRTHKRKTPEELRAVIAPNVGKGGNQGRKLVIGGKTYPHMTAARHALGCSYRTIYNMIADGRARYTEPK